MRTLKNLRVLRAPGAWAWACAWGLGLGVGLEVSERVPAFWNRSHQCHGCRRAGPDQARHRANQDECMKEVPRDVTR